MSTHRPVPPVFVAIVPALHFLACVATALGRIEEGWIWLGIFDFPVSLILMALTWRLEAPMLWFGVFGTLWWLGICLAVRKFWDAGGASVRPAK